jgi:uncharacterized glyoxalase superfamily protein PhnB
LGDAHILLATPATPMKLMLFLARFVPTARALANGPSALGVHIRIMVPNVDAMYQRAKAANAEIVREIGDRDYGLRDFILLDLDGYFIRFAAPAKQS